MKRRSLVAAATAALAAPALAQTLLESQLASRDRHYAYHQVSNHAFDTMMLRLRR
jgi:hypothetical protein